MKLRNKVENLVFAAVSRLDPRKYVRTHYAVHLRANWRDATFRYSVFGSYVEAISNYLKMQESHYTFIDIGANQGLFTLLASESKKCLHVHSFEPNPKTFLLLEENVLRLESSIKKKISLHELAIGDSASNEHLKLTSSPSHSGAATLEPIPPGLIGDDEETFSVNIVGHEFLNALEKVSGDLIVKIDVEGYEIGVLEQLFQSALTASLSALIVEISNDPKILDPALELIKLAGLTRVRKLTDNPANCDYMFERR